ncbi:YqgE/AlgH family protein [Actibacterium pelagium]
MPPPYPYMDLTGKLLIAMPGMGDPRFDQSVVFMCAHSDDGAMGLIVNKPADQVSFKDLLEQLGIPRQSEDDGIHVYFGGPVDHARGFVLHSGDYDVPPATLHVDDSFGMTATLAILEDLAYGQGPKKSLLALGYAGWGPGQLEDEIQANGWLTCDASPDLVFGEEDGDKWAQALASMGVDARLLSADAGRA